MLKIVRLIYLSFYWDVFSDLEAEHDDLQAKLNITKLKLKEAERTIEIKNPLGK